MTSPKKIAANQQNARHSSGPKSPSGKKNSSRNALKHGFFSRELGLSSADNRDAEIFRSALVAQYAPSTCLQELALEDVVCCYSRCVLGVRVERKMYALLVAATEKPQSEEPTQPAIVTRWYGSSRQDLRNGIRFLQAVKRDFEEHREIRDMWKESLESGFGSRFYEDLTKWTPMSPTAVALAVHLQTHAETFKHPLVQKADPVVIDPQQGAQMIDKLLDMKIVHLQELSAILQQSVSERNGNPFGVNFDFRHFALASRQLRSAVRWFFDLKEKGR
jgi:hypothetical protein